jgi:hypothetical protein
MATHFHETGDVHLDLPMEATPSSRFVTPRERPEMYPGTRPMWSYCFTGEMILPVRVEAGELRVLRGGKWGSLARFVEEKTACPLGERYAVLAVGSNACPARLADTDKFGGHAAVAIPVLRGTMEGLVSVYAPHLAAYGSVPSTVMSVPGASSNLWVTLLSEEELFRMDESEERGGVYDLVEFPASLFRLDGGIRIGPVSAYCQSRALRDRESGQAILLECFRAAGAPFLSMSQTAVRRLVDSTAGGLTDPEQKGELLVHAHSLSIPLPEDANPLAPRSTPASHVAIEPSS